MNINLDAEDIKEALTNYVSVLGFDMSNKQVTVNMVAGRQGNGYRAELEIVKGNSNNETLKVISPPEEPEISSEEESEEDAQPNRLFG